MTPDEFGKIGRKLYGQKKWQTSLADALHVDPSTIFRMLHRSHIPGPYVIALNALLENKKRMDEVSKEARRLLRDRKRLAKAKRGGKRPYRRKPVDRRIPYAGSEAIPENKVEVPDE